jgi:glycosyltransferase involved in cell wall biosynthesis
MKSPSVSIITPVYNEEKYLPFCLSSLKEQSFRDYEVIVIDDGSTDRSSRLAQDFGARVLVQSHQGTGEARNLGAKQARGKILVFVDADMKFDKDFLSYLVKPILEGKTIGTFQEEELVANPENIWARCWSFNSDLPQERRRPVSLPGEIGVFRAILKKQFLKIGGFDPSKGYMDDGTLAEKLKIQATMASGSKCYHFNPETLKEVFFSARWIGRSGQFPQKIENLLRYSFINSLRIGLRNFLIRKQPFRFIIFKIVYDLGMFQGIFFGKKGGAK